jgi:hypothetical protein
LEFPSAKHVANAHLTRLTHLLTENSHGRYRKDKAVQIRDLARESIASGNSGESFELQSVIRCIRLLDSEIVTFDKQIEIIIDGINSPIITIPGISYTLAAIIVAEIGNIAITTIPISCLPMREWNHLLINQESIPQTMQGWSSSDANTLDGHS